MLTNCEIKWWRTSSQGVQEHYFTIKLEDAIITNISARMPNCQDPGQAHFTHLEDVSFSYRKITWTHEIGSTSGEDDWRAPAS
jgi:type VI secretion system secreted protein Hcp